MQPERDTSTCALILSYYFLSRSLHRGMTKSCECLRTSWSKKKKECQINTRGPGYIKFERKGQKEKCCQNTSLLYEARHWEMEVIFQQKLVFPDII
ncbi:hypothetical protein DPMN_078293 [Dreissena polymorpha]|uniref:Uncharacterized protein n=1 Tax=Dreissena polymorpha TaxID=45954 RepID=A0A9D4BQD3_DREPO|nr:hypothetical protein DPMN_078293 [Dreissena polymorpha]